MVVSETTAGFIIERLELGQRVLLLVESKQQGRVAQQDVLTEMDEDQLEQARIKLGEVRLPGELGEGRLVVLSANSRGATRGLDLDAIYLPAGMELPAEAAPALMARDGIVLRYGAAA
jgi:hypothetical protein